MKDYKNEFGEWTERERLASLKLTKKAIADGEIPDPRELGCRVCGKKTGRIDYHNWNYNHPTKYLEAMCQGCHTMYHRYNNRERLDLWDVYKSKKQAWGCSQGLQDK